MDANIINALPQVAAMLREYYLEFEPSTLVLEKIVEDEPELQTEIEDEGFYDTNIREWILEEFTRFLIGREWPTYGDNMSREDLAELHTKLKAANDSFAA